MVLRMVRTIGRLWASGQYRSLVLLRLTGARNLFQHTSFTLENRYPAIFAFARERIADGNDVHLLSFGCSTGEEVFSLRRYFPTAAIRGLDINRGNVALCKYRLRGRPDERISFAVADSARGETASSYDAVFCMSVLRHGDLGETRPRWCGDRLRFSDFEAMVSDLADCVKPGGLLAIANSNFRFCDTAAFSGFETVFSRGAWPDESRTPVYDKDNLLLEGEVYREIIFRKRSRQNAAGAFAAIDAKQR